MANSTRQKNIKKNKQIEEIKKKLVEDEVIYKRNKEQEEEQINKGLGTDYKVMKQKIDFDLQEFKIKLALGVDGFRQVNPTFQYEAQPEYAEHLMKITKFMYNFRKKDAKEIEVKRADVAMSIANQNLRIEDYRKVAIEQLKELGIDTTEFEETKRSDYIG